MNRPTNQSILNATNNLLYLFGGIVIISGIREFFAYGGFTPSVLNGEESVVLIIGAGVGIVILFLVIISLGQLGEYVLQIDRNVQSLAKGERIEKDDSDTPSSKLHAP